MTFSYLSVCSGLGGAELAFAPLGARCVGVSEVDKFASAILAERFPDVPNFGDFTKITKDMVGEIDCLIGGPPCQAFSTAGLRAGINDPRGNLTLAFLALGERLSPEFIIYENVPGLLSVDNGETFESVLNGFNEIGYAVECDILDAQNFGLAQRRRRVFLVCHNVAIGRKKRSPRFAMSFGAFLTDCLLSVLAAQCAPSQVGLQGSDWPARFSADGLTKRMKLFGLLSETQTGFTITETHCFLSLLNDWAETLLMYHPEQKKSDSPSVAENPADGTRAGRFPIGSAGKMAVCPSTNTSLSWSDIWDALLKTANASIISTATKTTTNWTISICAEAALSIVEYTINSTTLLQNCLDEESSGLTALRVYTNYARQAANDLFGGLDCVCDWRDFVRRADRVISNAERNLGHRAHTGTLLPIPKSLRGNHPPRGKTREGIATTIAARTRGGGGLGTDFDCDGGLVVGGGPDGGRIAGNVSAKWAKGTGGPAGDEAYNLVAHSVSPPLTRNPYGDNGSRDGLLVAHSLRAEGFDASEDGTGRGTPLVPVAQNSRDEVRMLSVDGQIAGAIAAEPGVKQQTYVAHKMAVRRLTPRECERLQGVPDDWTRIPWRGKPAGECPDGPRYKAIGNSWAIPVVNWIGRRLLEAMP